MNILAIDPGPTKSAWIIYDSKTRKPITFGKHGNDEVLSMVDDQRLIDSGIDFDTLCDGFSGHFELVIEQVAAMGMAVGAEVFETVFWSGRFAQAWGAEFHRVKRHEVKMHLCGNMRAKDANIRQAIIDRYGPGADVAIGRKKTPGPLYGIAADVWSALAIAITFAEKRVGGSFLDAINNAKESACAR